MKKINFENLYNSTASRLLIADIIIKLLSYLAVQIASTAQMSSGIILQYVFFAVMTECAAAVLIAGILFLFRGFLKVSYDFTFAIKITVIALIFNNVSTILFYAVGLLIPVHVWIRHIAAALVSAVVLMKICRDHFPQTDKKRQAVIVLAGLICMILFGFNNE